MIPQFGEAMVAAREARGLSQRGAAIKADVDRYTLSDMERGVVPRNPIFILKCAKAYGVDGNEFLRLAEMEAMPTASDGAARFLAGLDELAAEFGEFTVAARGGMGSIRTTEDAERELANLRRMLEGGDGDERGKGGRGVRAGDAGGDSQRRGPSRVSAVSPRREWRGGVPAGFRLVVSPA